MVGPQQTTGLIGQKWKTGNGLELTGTNRPTQTTTPHPPHNRGGVGETAAKCEASTIRSTPNPPPNHTRVGGGKGRWATTPHNRINNTRRHRTANSRLGGHSDRETPGPIPNPEAKPDSADGTAPARVRESRTPPSTHHRYRVGLHVICEGRPDTFVFAIRSMSGDIRPLEIRDPQSAEPSAARHTRVTGSRYAHGLRSG